MQLRITIAMCMVEIRNRKTRQSKVNICKSDVKIGDYADSLHNYHIMTVFILSIAINERDVFVLLSIDRKINFVIRIERINSQTSFDDSQISKVQSRSQL